MPTPTPTTTPIVPGMIVESPDLRILGFMIYELHKTHVRVVKFAVAPDARRQGVGRRMVAKLVGKLSPARRDHIRIVAPETPDYDGPRFLQAMGFVATEVYRDTPEPGVDSIAFVYRNEWSD